MRSATKQNNSSPGKRRKPKNFVTILDVAKEMRLRLTDQERMAIGKVFFEKYLKSRKQDKIRFPWVGKVKEGRFQVRAYAVWMKPEIRRMVNLYLDVIKKSK